LLLGLRPEHTSDRRAALEPNQHAFSAGLEVTEPMGMDTLVYFKIRATGLCGRVHPNAGARAGEAMQLVMDLNHMHLIDAATGTVL
jgi:multiple sugar transport system ATP-binding protein